MNSVSRMYEFFESRGFVLDTAADGKAGLHLAMRESFDAIVTDCDLPRMDGLEMLKRLREAGGDAPVIMLSDRNELSDKISGFEAGADDYLTKPVQLPELEVRLKAVVSRVRGRSRSKFLRVADLQLDLDTMDVSRAGQPISLYPSGRKILAALMQASPAAVTRERLEELLWDDAPPNNDVLRSHIYELRRAVDGPFPVPLICTVRGVGYRLLSP